ncbi:glucocorticoid modulatory element-binding protein 1 [Hoplias malabaricus]|uniref:glucocorticoid modulatory element-binding protein 1 n=1 Tax=Hoplias malabaricus TaxID=27720 RepID=UPI00346202FF
MAETEVTVSMAEEVGDVVVMKTPEEEEGGADDANKMQVILQLQPITPGDGEESGESGATVVAIEAQDEALVEGDDVELGYPITCGESKAILLFKKFVCPGINVKCVKYEDQLISPKQFVHMSGKATLKDWKRAIRMGGVMLRKMMDSGQLDFYQHNTLCTNTCRSTKFDILINNTRCPPDSSVLHTPSATQGPAAVGNGAEVVLLEEKIEEASGGLDWSSVTVGTTEKKESPEISEDTLSFWRGIADVGLMGEVVSNIRTELLELLRGVQLRSDQENLQDAEVAVLSNLAQVFGLLDSIKRILSIRRQMTDPGEKQVLKTLTSLEQQLEEQKKQQSWLCQSQALSGLLAPSSSPPVKRAPKRPRLQRPASTTLLSSAVSHPVNLQQPQITVLSPITLPSIPQPITLTGLTQPSSGLTLHTLPIASQVFTRIGVDGKGETIALHPAQGLAQGLTVISPVELLRLTQGTGSAEHHGIEENGIHTATVIEIDPAPQEHGLGLVELQLEPEGGDEDESETERGEVEQRDGVEAEELQLESNGHIHNLQILVVEEERTQVEDKSK